LSGAIHTLGGSIHNLVHTFWQGNGSNGEVCPDFAEPFLRLSILCILNVNLLSTQQPLAVHRSLDLSSSTEFRHGPAANSGRSGLMFARAALLTRNKQLPARRSPRKSGVHWLPLGKANSSSPN